jgi:hypothetical protein
MAQAPEMAEEISRLRDGGAQRSRRSLVNLGGVLTVSLMREAWEGRYDLDNPGEVDQWYYPDKGIVVIDLEGDRND